jgi:1-deoxy-D-xylulose-5-phosphate reductoisomerase
MKSLPIAFNAANEVARNAFIAGEISFVRIFEILEQVIQQTTVEDVDSLQKIYEIDQKTRTRAQALL